MIENTGVYRKKIGSKPCSTDLSIFPQVKNHTVPYGPEKKVIIMPIKQTISRIKRTTNLKVKKIYRI